MRIRGLLAAIAVATLLLNGCGGGSAGSLASSIVGPSAAASATDASTLAVRAPQPADASKSYSDDGSLAENKDTQTTARALAVKKAVTTATSTPGTLNYSFNAPFSVLAPGWWINWWGSQPPSYIARQETGAAYVAAGAGAQAFRLNSVASDGDANLVYSYGFAKSTFYNISIKLRSDVPTRVRVQFRLDGWPYTEVSSKVVDLTPTWQTVVVSGQYQWSDAGSLRVIPVTLGTDIYLSEMTIEAVTRADSKTVSGLALPAQGASAVTLTSLVSYDMEGAYYNGFASGWFFNAYSGTSQGTFTASRETRADHVHTGAASQRFQVLDKKGGSVDLISQYQFVQGKTYHASFWMRADEATPIQAYMRMDAAPWQPFASATVTLNTTWQKIDIEGAYVTDAIGSLRVALLNATGTVWIDDVVISEVNKNDLAPVTTAAIPDTMFGMHVNQLGVHNKWPGLGTKIVRLWDTGTTWRDIEPTNNVWDFHRIDMYVAYVQSNDPQANIIYTMGITPQWASSTPNSAGLYGAGSNGVPQNMSDWRDYVRTLARRYAGKIRYWELWNEPDYAPHFNGSPANLVEMARIAKEELVAADPNNKLVSPGYSVGQGIPALDAFLSAGGGQYADIIGFHWYYSNNPESIGASMDNVRSTMKTYGADSKPLWNTEGAFICNSATMNCATATPTTDESRSVNARAMFVMAAKGIQNFNFYFWETDDPFGKLVEADRITPTIAATAMSEARSWIKGASLIDAYHVDDKAYVFRFTRGTDAFVVLWSLQANTVVNLPAAWNVAKVRTLLGVETQINAARQVTLGLQPLLLKL